MDRFVIRNPKTSTSTTNTVTVTSSMTVSTSTCKTIDSNMNKVVSSVTEQLESPDLIYDTVNEYKNEEVDDLNDGDENYDNAHQPFIKKRKIFQQKFKKDWQNQYNFLTEKNGTSFCVVCNTTIKGSLFHIKRHAESSAHKIKYNAARNTPKVDTVLKKDPRICLAEKIREAELLIVAFICENNLPFTLVNNLITLLKQLVPKDEVVGNLKMQRDKATNLITHTLGPFSKRLVFEKMKKERFSLIIDETTDISTKKSLVVVARFFDETAKEIQDHFIDLVEVVDTTSNSLFNAVKLLLDLNDIPLTNVIGLGADNASVMMGDINSVKQKFREVCPNIIVNGCSCHSLHLCASNACKKLPSTVEQFARDIYSHFSHSAKRSSHLKDCQIFCEEKPSKMLYPSQTRWLSLQAVCDRILKHWNSLILYFDEASKEEKLPMVSSILNALNNPIYKLYLQFLAYNLELVNTLNREFQSEKPKTPILLERISFLYKSILKSFIKKTIIDNSNLEYINILNPHNYLSIDDVYLGGKVDSFLKNPDTLQTVSNSDLHNFKIHCLQFYIELSLQLKKRFNMDDKYLMYASNFTPKKSVSGEVMSISEFTFLLPYLNVDPDKVNIEWQLISEVMKKHENEDITMFWKNVAECKNELGELMFSNLVEVVKCILSLPHSSAAAERVFSQMNLNKTKLRNRLNIVTISYILSIKQNIKNGLILPKK